MAKVDVEWCRETLERTEAEIDDFGAELQSIKSTKWDLMTFSGGLATLLVGVVAVVILEGMESPGPPPTWFWIVFGLSFALMIVGALPYSMRWDRNRELSKTLPKLRDKRTHLCGIVTRPDDYGFCINCFGLGIRDIRYPLLRDCTRCDGTGKYYGSECDECGGSGQVSYGWSSFVMDCPLCHGTTYARVRF